MHRQRWCDFDRLGQALSREFRGDCASVHGPAHWRRVDQNGVWLCRRTAADTLVVRLFAWFHDCKRENDYTDPGHGRRGADLARTLRGVYFDLEDESFEELTYACTWHTDKTHSSDITIGTCWDADRLDLGRVGVIPSPDFMSTDFGREVAKAGSFYPFVSEREMRNQAP